jgi:dihydropteroate synthase
MGILNITPNSFSDGGQYLDPAQAVAHAHALIAQGATILDLGAEASSFFRQGVQPIPPDEQLRRLLPVLRALINEIPPHIQLSIDTRSAQVAAQCLQAGAHLINDISAGTHDPDLLATVAHAPTPHGKPAGLILMHISPTYPATPPVGQDDPDILSTVAAYLEQRVQAAQTAGISFDRLAIDPGIGFGKTMADNWRLALLAPLLATRLQLPVVIGLSRKRFLETPPPADLPGIYPEHLPTLDQLRRAAATLPNIHARDPATALLTALIARANHSSPPQIHRLHHLPLAQSALSLLPPNPPS